MAAFTSRPLEAVTGSVSGKPVRNATSENRYCPFRHRAGTLTFHRFSVAVTSNTATMSVNLHPIWVESNGIQTSPWLGLTSRGDSRPLFRNFKVTGHPTIPRSVRLSDGELLRSWQPQAWGIGSKSIAQAASDWSISQGVIQAARDQSEDRRQSEGSSKTELIQRLLSYERPLLIGESVNYEFFYEPGVSEINPAIGRVGFLLQPEGVRIHWLTDDDEWTSLSVRQCGCRTAVSTRPATIAVQGG